MLVDTLGLEAAGTVTYVPEGSSSLKAGDEVMGFVVGGLGSHAFALPVSYSVAFKDILKS